MFNFTLNEPGKDKAFQEGMIGDVLNGIGVDTGAIGSAWNPPPDPNTGIAPDRDIPAALQTTSDQIANGRRTADAVDKHILSKMRVDNRSIVARARNSILQFPCYITQSCPVAPAQTISKLFERVYTTLVQTVLSQNQIMDEEQANNLVFLKQFHTNLKESTEEFLAQYESLNNMFYQPIDELDQMMVESIYCEHVINDVCKVMFRVVPTTNPDLIAECARLCNEPLSGFAYLREAPAPPETTRETTASFDTVTEEQLRQMAIERGNLTDDQRRLLNMSPNEIRDDVRNRLQDDSDPDQAALTQRIQEEIRDRMDDLDMARDAADHALDQLKQDIRNGNIRGYSFDGVRYRRANSVGKTIVKPAPNRRPSDYAVAAPTVLRESDIKKMNAMLPYTIEATFRLRTRNGLDRDIKFIIGIKTVMHLIRTQDLAEDLRELVTGRVKSLQKVRYKTGEISFKDYLFNPKQLKADAAKNLNGNKRWVNTLKRLADYNQQYGSFLKGPIQGINKGDVPIPNGTLVLTQPDVTTLTNETGIDLSQVGNAKRLAKSLFLIAVCIVDSSAGTMRVLFPDSDNDWDVQSLASVDAEVSKTDNSQLMRELNHLVNR